VSINDDTSHYVYILIHTISVKSQPTMKVNIHNQCSDFKLTDREYLSNSVDWDKRLDWKIDASSMTSADLTPFLSTFEGVLTYRLEKEEVKLTCIRLFVTWKSEGYKKFHVFVQLVEYDKRFSWNDSKLERYYQRHAKQLSAYTDPIKDTWLIHGGKVLMTELELIFTKKI
jgi:hypothetical protein